MSLVEKYPDEFQYISKKYPNISTDLQQDYIKQLVSHRKKTGKKTPFGRIPLGWNCSLFHNYILEEQEQDDFFENPLGSEVYESVVSCLKCGSSKTFNIEKQTRSLDEPTTVITICYNCKHRQKYSG